EGGVGTNGLVTGLDWANFRTTPGFAFGTQLGTAGAPGKYNDSTALVNGTWGPNQTVSVTIKIVTANTSAAFTEVACRLRSNLSAHSNTGYEILVSVSHNTAGGYQYMQIVRWIGAWGNSPGIGSGSTPSPPPQTGDVLTAAISGSTITATLKRGTTTIASASATDSTYASGFPGMGHYWELGGGS